MRSVSAEGVLWFFVMFSSLSTTWYYKLAYDCRLVTDDLAHKIVDVVEAIFYESVFTLYLLTRILAFN